MSNISVEHTKVIDRTTADTGNQTPHEGATPSGRKQIYDRVPDGAPEGASKRSLKVINPNSGGDGAPGADGDIPFAVEQHGWVSSYGSTVRIQGGAHNESIDIIHSSGTNITINPDGSIGIVAGPALGLGSTSGDVNLSAARSITITGADVVVASRGHLTLKSETAGITMEAPGGIVIESGEGSILTKAGNRIVMTSGADTSITATDAFAVTTGATASIQANSNFTVDAGQQSKIVAGEANEMHGKTFKIKGKGDSEISSTKKVTMKSGEDMNIESNVSLFIKSKDSSTLEGKNFTEIKSATVNIQTEGGSVFVDADESVVMTSKNTTVSATEALNMFSGTTTMSSKGTFDIDADGAMDIRASTIDLNKGAPATTTPNTPETTSPEEASAATEPDTPKTVDPKTISEAVGTSRIAAPTYQGNAYKKNQATMSTEEGEGTPVPDEAKQIAESTPDPAVATGEIDGTEDTGITENSDGQENVLILPIEPAPPDLDTSSGTLGHSLFPGYDKIPADGQTSKSLEQIKHNIETWLFNVHNRVVDQFPDVNVRVGPRGFILAPAGATAEQSGHFTGLAGDLSFGNDLNNIQVAQIAQWIHRNMHVDDVIIEKDKSGRAHIHVLIPEAPAGGEPVKGRRSLFTCNDYKCSSPEEGIKLEYLTGTLPTATEEE
jgi:hypothetical protein